MKRRTRAYLASLFTTSRPTVVNGHRIGDQWFIEVHGDLDLSTIAELEAELLDHPNGPLVLDIGGVEFIDSSAIALLARHAERMTVINPTRHVERLLHLCSLDTERIPAQQLL